MPVYIKGHYRLGGRAMTGKGMFDALDPNQNGALDLNNNGWLYDDPNKNYQIAIDAHRNFNPNNTGIHPPRTGQGIWDWADPNRNGVANAFDPNRNGVANAFDPNRNGVANAFDPYKNGVANAFDPNKNGITTGINNFATKTLPSALIHYALPAAAEFVGSKFGVGNEARKLGEMGATELGNVTGLGLCYSKNAVMPEVNFPEGSEARAIVIHYFKIINPEDTPANEIELDRILNEGLTFDKYTKFIKRGYRIEEDPNRFTRTTTRAKTGLEKMGEKMGDKMGNFLAGKGLKRLKKGSPEAKAFMKSLRDRKRK